jgi:hypothetical protein
MIAHIISLDVLDTMGINHLKEDGDWVGLG